MKYNANFPLVTRNILNTRSVDNYIFIKMIYKYN